MKPPRRLCARNPGSRIPLTVHAGNDTSFVGHPYLYDKVPYDQRDLTRSPA
jgi:hypothetical protein